MPIHRYIGFGRKSILAVFDRKDWNCTKSALKQPKFNHLLRGLSYAAAIGAPERSFS
jgi:hypothetical protein